MRENNDGAVAQTTAQGRTYTGTIINLWTVYETVDEYGRRGDLIGYFDNTEAAGLAARGRGYFGGNGAVIPGHGLLLTTGGVIPLAVNHPVALNVDAVKHKEKVRAAALAKLSDEERAVLNIPE